MRTGTASFAAVDFAVLCGAEAQPTSKPTDLMTADLYDAEIRDVLQAIGAAFTLSILIDLTVSGTVTISIEDVYICEVFDFIISRIRVDCRRFSSLVP